MSKISCDICKDLIPLVKDEISTEDSRNVVKEHIKTCESCRKLYGDESLEQSRNPDLDRELTVRAKAALRRDPDYACRLLDACADRSGAYWQLLRGRAAHALGRWQEAAEHLTAAEEAYPRETAQPLEQCWRELGDYRRAYDYACRSRAFGS